MIELQTLMDVRKKLYNLIFTTVNDDEIKNIKLLLLVMYAN